MRKLTILLLVTSLVVASGQLSAQTLKGSRESMEKQSQLAVTYGYSFIETSDAIPTFVNSGELFRVQASRHLELHDVSYPYARAGVKLFLERLSAQYYGACGEKLTVTSLSRPRDKQPANAAANSVHPTGMAVDLRVSNSRRCRSWLEQTLLSLEAADVLDVTRERNPPHYHVAVYTNSYQDYVANLALSNQEYVVRPGDSLWEIASRTGTTVAQLQAANYLSGSLINVGQKLQIPAGTGLAAVPANIAAENTSHSSSPVSTREVSHRVRRGETLWRLANRYGTSVDQIKAQNGLSGNLLQVGQVLRISSSKASI